MNTNYYLSMIKQIDQLARMQATGTPDQLANKLHISKRTLHNYISELKNIGLPITYSRDLQSYIYTKEGMFVVEFMEVEA